MGPPIPFRLLKIEKKQELNCSGIYSFWREKVCLYVGKAEKQSIRDRLIQHDEREHNERLQKFFTVLRKKITIRWECMPSNSEKIDFKNREQHFIDLFEPLTNKINARSR